MPELETRSAKVENGWRDHDGFVGPREPGTGPRSDPKGEFPTGPNVGGRIPNIVCRTARGETFDLDEDRGDRPAVVVFYRSAVW